MAGFLRNNQPWAQLIERGNISIREVDSVGADGNEASVRLTPSISFFAVDVPHRAELSDTVAYVVSLSSNSGVARATVNRSEVDTGSAGRVVGRDGGGEKALKLLYCPDTDGWTGWKRSIKDWCEEVDVALLDATFYDKDELKGRNMSEVPVMQASSVCCWIYLARGHTTSHREFVANVPLCPRPFSDLFASIVARYCSGCLYYGDGKRLGLGGHS